MTQSSETRVLAPDAGGIAEAAACLAQGGLVAFPTETVYGLGADASNDQAVRKIYVAKGRPRNHPLIVHLADAQAIARWATDVPPAVHTLAQAFWPGPLTLILRRAPHVSELVTGGQETVALRVPSHPVARTLLTTFGDGIAAPSANRYGRVSATTAEHVRAEFGEAVDVVLDGGACDVGIESTIVDLSGSAPALLRPGSIGAAALEAVLGVTLAASSVASPRVPGSTAKHYAPQTPLMLIETGLVLELAVNMAQQGSRVAVLARSTPQWSMEGLVWIAAPSDPQGYAHDLYSNLRALDAAGCMAMLVEQPPLEPEWAAVHDRLQRAAAGSSTPDET